MKAKFAPISRATRRRSSQAAISTRLSKRQVTTLTIQAAPDRMAQYRQMTREICSRPLDLTGQRPSVGMDRYAERIARMVERASED